MSKWEEVTSTSAQIPLRLVHPNGIYHVYWLKEVSKDEVSQLQKYTYWYREYVGKPTPVQLRLDIEQLVNAQTDEAILSGMVWQGKRIWLSQENQMNFKAAYDLAVQTDGAILPVTFKLGETAEGVAHYHTFTTMQEFTDFYTTAFKHINACLQRGWDEKESINQLTINN